MRQNRAQRRTVSKASKTNPNSTKNVLRTVTAKSELVAAIQRANDASESLEKQMRIDPKLYHEPVTF